MVKANSNEQVATKNLVGLATELCDKPLTIMQDIKQKNIKYQNNYNIDFIDTMTNEGSQNIRKPSIIHKNH